MASINSKRKETVRPQEGIYQGSGKNLAEQKKWLGNREGMIKDKHICKATHLEVVESMMEKSI